LKIFHHQSQQKWDEDLPLLASAFNTAYESTKFCQARLFLGTELATPLESMWDLTRVNVSNNLEKGKDFWAKAIKNLRMERDQVACRYNATRKETPFKVGDIVVHRVKVLSSKGASHKPNPLTVPQGIMDSYSTLSHVGGSNSCGGYTLLGVTVTHAGYWGSGLPKPRWKVSCRRLHGTGVETAVLLMIPLGNQAAPHCM
jgi:hypothetical protein